MSQPSLKVNLPRRSGDVQLARWNRSGSAEEEEEEENGEEEGKEEDNYNDDDARNSTRWMVMRTSTGYARKPRDRIQISLTRDRIICFSRIPVSTVIVGRAVQQERARLDSSHRDHRVIYVQRGSSR